MIAVAVGPMLTALEEVEKLLVKSEPTLEATIGVGAGEYVLLEDEEVCSCAKIVDESGRELV